MVIMTQSKQSIEVAVKAGWINYQSLHMNIDPEAGAKREVPLQFRHIFMIGYSMGEARAEKRLGPKVKRVNAG